MAPIAELTQLGETDNGLAFEVQIKSPVGADMMTPGRRRLEAYGACSGGKLPRLLRATALSGPSPGEQAAVALKCPAAERIAEKAVKMSLHGAFEQALVEPTIATPEPLVGETSVAEEAIKVSLHGAFEQALVEPTIATPEPLVGETSVAEEVQHIEPTSKEQHEAEVEKDRKMLFQEGMEGAAHRRSCGLAKRSLQAGKHFQQVQARVGARRQQRADACAEQLRLLDGRRKKAEQKRADAVSARQSKASAHSRSVQQQAEQRSQTKGNDIEDRRQNLEQILERAAQRRGAALAARRSKAGSHFSDVLAKVGARNDDRASATLEQRGRLGATLLQQHALHLARALNRSVKAGLHNREVQAKLETYRAKHEELRQSVEQARKAAPGGAPAAACVSAAARAARARRHNEAVARQRVAAYAAEDRRLAAMRERLARKGCRRQAPSRVLPPSAPDVAPAPAARSRRLGGWLARLIARLPCGDALRR